MQFEQLRQQSLNEPYSGQSAAAAGLGSVGVVCYGLKSSKWYQLPVSKLTPVQWVTESLKNLVIDPDTKDMLVGLVQQHRKNLDGGLGDIIESKVKGLIVTVAEFTEKPLYPLNIGQLKSQSHMENLHRNGIVSVFLRMLEYYEGIIFLTINRLLTMDPAFESRIQLAIRLPGLSVSSRRQIWKNLINRLNPEEAFGKQELMDHLDELEKWELNGRQIRNVLSTTETFALGTQHRRGALRFRMVQNMVNEVIRFHDFFEDGAHERKAQLRVINPRQFQERRRF
ncbi:P-loop containing nucleoside triphosphate hydrolase protein [Cladorrhinum sp. PSN259]|nr:P-loop containing nucleoside triphosphate hydrolase protein [Cladorrhinum sp. PSN259]